MYVQHWLMFRDSVLKQSHRRQWLSLLIFVFTPTKIFFWRHLIQPPLYNFVWSEKYILTFSIITRTNNYFKIMWFHFFACPPCVSSNSFQYWVSVVFANSFIASALVVFEWFWRYWTNNSRHGWKSAFSFSKN